jgi:hypothetical protein
MFGLGKPRSRYGRFIDLHGIEQERIREVSKVSRSTLTRICSSDDYIPSGTTMKKVLYATRKLTGAKVTQGDFWPM